MRSFRIPRWFVPLLTAAVAVTAVVVLHVGPTTTVKTESKPSAVVAYDGIRWELLQSIADQVMERFAKRPDGVSQKHHKLVYLWSIYRMSPRSEKSQTVEDIREALKEKAKFNMANRIIEVLLFGPPDDRISSQVIEPQQRRNCFGPTLQLFKKHCGVPLQQGLDYATKVVKICDELVDMAGVEEVFKVACSNRTLG